MNLQLLRGKTLPANDVAIVCKWSKARKIMPDECAIDERDGSAVDFMPGEDVHLKSCEKLLRKCEERNFNEMIAYWMMEGYLGRINSVEEAYQKGHKIFMQLKNDENQEPVDTQEKASEDTREKAVKHKEESEETREKASDKQESEDIQEKVVKDREESEKILEKVFKDWTALSTYRRYRESLAIMRLGFDDVFDGEDEKMPDLGKLVPDNGAIKTFRKHVEQEKCSTFLLDGNRLGREVVPEFFDKDLKHLAYFNPRPRLFQLKSPVSPLLISPSLSVLVLRGCSLLEEVDKSIGQMENLQVLEISESKSIRKLPETLFAGMSKLRILNLSCLGIEDLPAKSFAKLVSLRRLILRGCFRLKELPSTKDMTHLKVIDLCGAKKFERLRTTKLGDHKIEILDLSHTPIHRVPNLIKQSGGSASSVVTHLFLRNCRELYVLDIVQKMKSLEVLDLSGAVRLRQMNSLDSNGLRILDLSRTDLHSLPESFFRNMGDLEELNLSETKLSSIPSLSDQSNLRRLIVKNCPVESLPTLVNLSSLGVLDVSGCDKLQHLEGLSSCSKLLVLNLSGCTALKKMEDNPFGKLTSLRSLDLSKTKAEIYETEFLRDLKLLKVLDLSETSIKDLPPMRNLERLKQLSLAGNGGLKAVPDLDAFSELEVLDLSGTGVGNEILGKAPSSLRRLLLKDCPEIKGSLVLSSFTRIQELDLRGSGVTEFPVEDLRKMPELKSLRLPETIDVAGVDLDRVKFPEEILWEINCLSRTKDRVEVFKSGKISIGSYYMKSLLAEAEDKSEAVETKDEKEESTSADVKGGSKESMSANETDGNKESTSAGEKDGGKESMSADATDGSKQSKSADVGEGSKESTSAGGEAADGQSMSADAKDENKSEEAEGGKEQSTLADGSKESTSSNETDGSKQQSMSAGGKDGDRESTSADATDGSKQSMSTGATDGSKLSTSADATDGSKLSISVDATDGSKQSTSADATDGSKQPTSADATDGSKQSTSADVTDGSKQPTLADATDGSKQSTSAGATDGSKQSTSADVTDGSKQPTSADATDGSKQSTSADATDGSKQSTSADATDGRKQSTSADATDGDTASTSADATDGSKASTSADAGDGDKQSTSSGAKGENEDSTSSDAGGGKSTSTDKPVGKEQSTSADATVSREQSTSADGEYKSTDSHSFRLEDGQWEAFFKKFRFTVSPPNVHFGGDELAFKGRNFANLKPQGRSVEIHGFSSIPEAAKEALKQAINVALIGNNSVESLSDLSSHDTPEMKVCWIRRCEEMKFVIQVKNQSFEVPERLETLVLSNLVSLVSFCDESAKPNQSIESLKHVYVDCCPALSKIISGSSLLINLESLHIQFCDGLMFVCDGTLPNLRRLKLSSLPKLEKIGCNLPALQSLMIRECPELCDLRDFFVSATQLARLSLHSCPKLQIVFSSSMPNLEELEIRSCDELTALIENPRSPLPKLRSLKLWSLPKMEDVERDFPSLRTCQIEHCPRLPQMIWPQINNRSNTGN